MVGSIVLKAKNNKKIPRDMMAGRLYFLGKIGCRIFLIYLTVPLENWANFPKYRVIRKRKVIMVRIDTQKLQYLNIIQNVITRMADNSFKIKNWAILVNSGLFTLYFTKGRWQILTVAMFITVMFFALDVYYLALERQFRQKHESVVEHKKLKMFDMSVNLGFRQYAKAVLSPTMILYGALFGVSALVLIIRYLPDMSNVWKFIINVFCGG